MKKIDFLATDGLKLNGLLYESNQKTDKVILSVHGMSSNCLKNREDILSKCMNQNNIDYFCFNNRGSELVRYIQKDINGEKLKIEKAKKSNDTITRTIRISGKTFDRINELEKCNIP